MSSTQYISDATIRHQVFLQRYAGGESKRAIAALSRIRRDIVARLANEPTEFRASRLNAALDDINAITATGFKDIALDIKASSYKLASIEADFSTALYTRASDADFVLPPDSALIQSVEASGMAAALATGQKNPTIDAALTDFSKQKAKQINQIIADGVTLGDTTPEISRRLATTINTLQKRQLDALVRTITNHTSSAARIAVYDQNADIIEGYEWVATLDNRTTLICGSRDGNIYQVGKGPLPPAHWNCRSTTVPVVNDAFNIAKKATGKRPAVGADGAGQVGGKSTYGGWLKKQPKEFVDEALGVERSRLFRSGKLSIDKFVDPTGRVYTLDQLAQMNQFAFQEF